MAEEQEWSEIDTSKSSEKKEEVAFEVENEEPIEKVEAVVEEKEEVKEEPVVQKKEIPELEGIETDGASKRIQHLVKQRKEREEALIKAQARIEALEKQQAEITKGSLNLRENANTSSEKLLQQQLEMAKQSYLDAYDSGNKEKMLASQEAISKAQVDLNNIDQDKSNLERVKKRNRRSSTS